MDNCQWKEAVVKNDTRKNYSLVLWNNAGFCTGVLSLSGKSE